MTYVQKRMKRFRGDIVYHLGDVLGDKTRFKAISKLKGIKRLIVGNHDDISSCLLVAGSKVMMWRMFHLS